MSDLGWYGRTWYDRKQNQEIGSLSARLERQRTEARRLTAKLSEVQGNLEVRLNRLTTAFDAFVELSDLREELRAFHAEAAARQRARRAVRTLLAGRPVAGPDTVADSATPGYWLPPALASLVASLAGDTTVDDADLAAARECDPLRTDLFLCLGRLLAGRVGPATVLLGRLLDLRADRPVIRAQRDLWLAGAAGRFGPAGRAVVADGLATLVAGLAGDARTAAVAPWRQLVDGIPVDGAFVTGFRQRAEPPADLVAPILAARRLDALADWHAKALSAPAEPAADAVADLVAPAAPADDPLVTLLGALIDEGAPDEQPLLARVVELRRVLEPDGGDGAPAPSRWREELDAPLALLRADARSDDAARRTVAVRAAGPLLATIAAELRTAAGHPVPDRAEVRIGRHELRFGPMGADPATVGAARAATLREQQSPPAGYATQVGWGLVGGGVVALLVGILLAGPGLGITLGLIVGGGGVWTLVHARRVRESEQASRRRREADWARIEGQIAEVEAALADLRTQARKAPENATSAHTRLTHQLAPTP